MSMPKLNARCALLDSDGRLTILLDAFEYEGEYTQTSIRSDLDEILPSSKLKDLSNFNYQFEEDEEDSNSSIYLQNIHYPISLTSLQCFSGSEHITLLVKGTIFFSMYEEEMKDYSFTLRTILYSSVV